MTTITKAPASTDMERSKEYTVEWSGRRPVPVAGDRVMAYINGLGAGTVAGHFVVEGYLGVIVNLDSPPDWYVRQNGGNNPAHLFGIEIEPKA